MSSVAARLGYTTMSLYRYVSAKDDLIVLMNDEGLGQPPDHDAIDDDWRTGLRRWAGRSTPPTRAIPGCWTSRSTASPITPNNLAWLDWGLRILAPARLSVDRRRGGRADAQRSRPAGRRSSTGPSRAASRATPSSYVLHRAASTPTRYPALVAALADGGFERRAGGRPVPVRAGAGSGRRGGRGRVRGRAGPEPSASTRPSRRTSSRSSTIHAGRRLKEATRTRGRRRRRLREARGKGPRGGGKAARRATAGARLITKAREKAAAAERG